MNLQVFLGISATAIAFISYIPYFRDIFLGKTKPHAISWFIWGILTAIGFFGQVYDNGGPGAWVTGFTALIAFFIFVAALKKGEKNIVLIDWLSLAGALLALLLWYVTKTPLFSVILITVVDIFGFIPTFRKSYMKPHQETLITYFLSGLKFFIALFALSNLTVITSFYTISLIVMNWVFIIFAYIRRHQLNLNPIQSKE